MSKTRICCILTVLAMMITIGTACAEGKHVRATFSLEQGGEELERITADGYLNENQLLVRTDLLPGFMLEDDLSGLIMASEDTGLQYEDLVTMRKTDARSGFFSGDTFELATWREDYTVSLDPLLFLMRIAETDQPVFQGLMQILTDIDVRMSVFDQNRAVSITVQKDGETVMTGSAEIVDSIPERIVIGYGWNGKDYYWELQKQPWDGAGNTTRYILRMLADDQKSGYGTLQADAQVFQAECRWVKKEAGFSFDGSFTPGKANIPSILFSGKLGLAETGNILEAEIRFDGQGYPTAVLTVDVDTQKVTPAQDETKISVFDGMTEAEQMALAKAAEQKMIPLLTTLQGTIPETYFMLLVQSFTGQ